MKAGFSLGFPVLFIVLVMVGALLRLGILLLLILKRSLLVLLILMSISCALFRVVRLGGHRVRKARGNAADARDAADVFLYRDSSIAPLLDMRRRFKAVMDVLGAIIQYGVSLSRSVEPTAQWDRILAAGPLYLVTLDDLSADRDLGIGDFYRVVSDFHHRLSDFIHAVVVCRRDVAVRRWRDWIWEDTMVHPYRWLRPDLVPLLLFFSVSPILHLVVLVCLLILLRLMKNSERLASPFCRSGQRDTTLEEFDREVGEWLALLPEVVLPRLTRQMLADVVQRKGATAGSLDGWVWRELKVLPVSWYDELARILSKVEDFDVWPDWLLDDSQD